MSVQHILEDDAFNEITYGLRTIKSVARILAAAADDDSAAPDDVSNIGYLIYDMVNKVEGLMEAPDPTS
jgi:hypothetical protein